MSKDKNAREFKEFYFGIIHAVHSGCPFIVLARLVDRMISPQVLSRIPIDNYLPFFVELPIYISADDLKSEIGSSKDMVITAVQPDISRNKTLVIGFTLDQVIRAALLNDELKYMTIGPIQSRLDYEAFPVISINREDILKAEKILKDAASANGGDAFLDIIGRVSTVRDLANLREILNPEPPVVPGLTTNEARILEAAIAFGYYESPRRITQEELAKKLNMPKSTLSEILRRIENRIINNTLR